jgi:hypothetical protein
MRRTRRWAWYGAVAMHLSVLAVLQIGSVSIGMLIFHAFIFDPAWLPVHARQAVRAQFGTRIGLPPTALAVNPKSMP